MRVLLNPLLAGAALVFASAIAGAATITQSVQFGPGPTDYSGAPGTPALFYFDSNLGTLNAVTFSSAYQFTSYITLTNTSTTNTSSGTARTESGAQFASTSSAITSVLNSKVNTRPAVVIGSNSLSPAAYDVLGNSQAYTLSPGTSTTNMSSGSASTNGVTDTSASDLSAFFKPGGGTYTILLSTLTGTLLSATGGNTIGQS